MLPETLPEGLTEEMVEVGAELLNRHEMENDWPGPEGCRTLEQSIIEIWCAMQAAKEKHKVVP